jgi:hypothetical protein
MLKSKPTNKIMFFVLLILILSLCLFVSCFNNDESWRCALSTPTFIPVAGSVASGTEIGITTTQSECNIYYIRDNSTPTTQSILYSDTARPTITQDTIIKAISEKNGYQSPVATAAYTIYVGD